MEVETQMDRDEVLARFPEVEDIRDDELAEKVIGVIQQFPDYFWTAPASSNHHPPEHQARHGLWLHTKRVSTVFERLAPSMVNQGHLEWYDIDCGRAACILHDMFKYGEPPTSVDGTTKDHDVTAAEWLDTHEFDIPESVVDSVEAHNGPWYRGSPPRSHLEQIVHIADMVASDENCRIAVKEPHDTLVDQFPRVEAKDE